MAPSRSAVSSQFRSASPAYISECAQKTVIGSQTPIIADFFNSLGAVLEDKPATVIMDNAPVHRGPSFGACTEVVCRRHTLHFFNPIESMFAVLKMDLKQRLHHVQSRLDGQEAALAAGHCGLLTRRSSILEYQSPVATKIQNS